LAAARSLWIQPNALQPTTWNSVSENYWRNSRATEHLWAGLARAFSLSADLAELLAKRNLTIGFDIYCSSAQP
jgi:hypothetical protein